MKTRTILATILAAIFMTGCVTGSGDGGGTSRTDEKGTAFISLKVYTPTRLASRSSEEDPGATPLETDIHKLYAVTFDSNNNIITYGSSLPAQVVDISDSQTKPKAFQVSSNAKGLLLVANPGSLLEGVLTGAGKGMSFDALNAAITSTSKVSEIVDTSSGGKGFTMINSGNELVDNDEVTTPNSTLCLVNIAGKMQVVGKNGHDTAAEAQAAAEDDANRVLIGIERLSAKIEVVEKDGGATATGATFGFDGWVLDAVNTMFFPWAKKVDTKSAVGGSPQNYVNNFYTIDPNYMDDTGISYNKVVDYVPDVTWLADKTITYCIENTMKAGEQRFKNATRVVMMCTYWPDDTWTGDWFSFGGTAYQNFPALKAAYNNNTSPDANLRDACERFFGKLKAASAGSGVDFSGKTTFDDISDADFTTLTGFIQNGGEMLKEDDCIRWYQEGLCYYWYEIRHDDSITDPNAFAKYGVVRNNWYKLTLNSVSKAGTPWYPDIKNPGDEDPDPEDPIDDQEGYLGVTIEVMPWVKWGHNIDL